MNESLDHCNQVTEGVVTWEALEDALNKFRKQVLDEEGHGENVPVSGQIKFTAIAIKNLSSRRFSNFTPTVLSKNIESPRGGHPPQRWWVITPPIFIPFGG